MSVTLSIYHFFMIRSFNILSATFFKLCKEYTLKNEGQAYKTDPVRWRVLPGWGRWMVGVKQGKYGLCNSCNLWCMLIQDWNIHPSPK
jgi:hypothetical protein